MRNNNNNQQQQQRHLTTASGQVGKNRKYGDIDNSDYVHPEIIELGNQLKVQMKQLEIRDESSLLDNLRMGGPSEQSKQQLRRELEGAQQAIATGNYYVYRNVAPPKINPRTGKPFMARQQEECCRLSQAHKCFCGHPLSAHRSSSSSSSSNSSSALISRRGGSSGSAPLPPCTSCDCAKFVYIPNQPEEVGDGFLSRRKGFDPSLWSAKCKCGHGSRSHDPTTKSCRECRSCYGFEGNFVCGVCDGRWEEHATILESEMDRQSKNLATGNDYIPLAGVDPEFREIVFGEETAKALPPSSSAMIAKNRQLAMNHASASSGGHTNKAIASSSSSGPMSRAQRQHMMEFNQEQQAQQQQPPARNFNHHPRVEEVHDDQEVGRFAPQQQRPPQQQLQRPPPQQQAPPASSTTTTANSNPQQITCTQCDQINRRLAKFCRVCGAKL